MIVREERIANQRLILGDCLQVMPTLGRFDAVVTDPPYGLGARMKGGTWGAQDRNSGFLRWDGEARQEWADAILTRGGGRRHLGRQLLRLAAHPLLADLEQDQCGADHG